MRYVVTIKSYDDDGILDNVTMRTSEELFDAVGCAVMDSWGQPSMSIEILAKAMNYRDGSLCENDEYDKVAKKIIDAARSGIEQFEALRNL